jgi:hypothetical protein
VTASVVVNNSTRRSGGTRRTLQFRPDFRERRDAASNMIGVDHELPRHRRYAHPMPHQKTDNGAERHKNSNSRQNGARGGAAMKLCSVTR